MTKLDAWLRKNRPRPRKETTPQVQRLEEEKQAANEKRRAAYQCRKARRAVAAKPRNCAVCGADLRFRRKDSKFCSDACRQAAHRERAVTNSHEKTKEPLRTNEKAVTGQPKSRDKTAKKPLRTNEKAVTKILKVRVITTPPKTVMVPYYVPRKS